jgi:hypothetical protein
MGIRPQRIEAARISILLAGITDVSPSQASSYAAPNQWTAASFGALAERNVAVFIWNELFRSGITLLSTREGRRDRTALLCEGNGGNVMMKELVARVALVLFIIGLTSIVDDGVNSVPAKEPRSDAAAKVISAEDAN